MIIPGYIMPYITFPGIIMHEIAHRLMCDFFGIAVYEVRYFIIGPEESGYVIHERIDSLIQSFFVVFAPLFINTALCMLFTLPFHASSEIVGFVMPHHYFLLWLGISMGANAMPSQRDISNFLNLAEEKGESDNLFVQVIASIFSALHQSAISIDLLYAYGISRILPHLFLS